MDRILDLDAELFAIVLHYPSCPLQHFSQRSPDDLCDYFQRLGNVRRVSKTWYNRHINESRNALVFYLSQLIPGRMRISACGSGVEVISDNELFSTWSSVQPPTMPVTLAGGVIVSLHDYIDVQVSSVDIRSTRSMAPVLNEGKRYQNVFEQLKWHFGYRASLLPDTIQKGIEYAVESTLPNDTLLKHLRVQEDEAFSSVFERRDFPDMLRNIRMNMPRTIVAVLPHGPPQSTTVVEICCDTRFKMSIAKSYGEINATGTLVINDNTFAIDKNGQWFEHAKQLATGSKTIGKRTFVSWSNVSFTLPPLPPKMGGVVRQQRALKKRMALSAQGRGCEEEEEEDDDDDDYV